MTKYARIDVPVADVWREAGGNDLDDQLLFNQVVKLTRQEKGQTLTYSDFGEGWVRTAHFVETDQPASPLWMIRKPTVGVLEDDRQTPQTRLASNTRVTIADEDRGWRRIITPGGKLGWVPIRALVEVSAVKYSVEDARRRVMKLLGAPYLWGGKTPWGFDCSGLVMNVFGYYGLEYTHSAAEQQDIGEEVAREDIQPMDLLFFPGHVAISLGGQAIIHANRRTNSVSIDSLDRPARDYHPVAKDLIVIKRPPLAVAA